MQVGFSSPAQTGIIEELGLSVAEVSPNIIEKYYFDKKTIASILLVIQVSQEVFISYGAKNLIKT